MKRKKGRLKTCPFLSDYVAKYIGVILKIMFIILSLGVNRYIYFLLLV